MPRNSGFLVVLSSLFMVFFMTSCQPAVENVEETNSEPTFGMVIHGGAGTILRENMTAETEAEYRAKLDEALQTGYAILNDGGTAMDAVIATINVMEDSPLFNAGKGAVFTANGENELDAAVMDGNTLNAGAVSGVRHIRNPINLARLVMDESPHVMLSGTGAEEFARQFGIEEVDPEYFRTERRWEQLLRAREAEAEDMSMASYPDLKFGTVGAVALDLQGNLAAGTSTGGMTNKKFGRIGDAPIIGAGTYANNETCAVSATGHGEYFIRSVVAHDIAALMEYKGLSLEEASRFVVKDRLVERGGSGGIIAIDAKGNMAMPFNTPGMYRGWITADGTSSVLIYGDENEED